MKIRLLKSSIKPNKWLGVALLSASVLAGSSQISQAQELYKSKWSSIIGSFVGLVSSNFANEISTVKLDLYGNAYYGGYFSGGITVNGVTYTSTFNNGYRSNSPFLAKVDVSGNIVWFKAISGSGGSAKLTSLVLANNGTIYITGCYTGNLVTGTTTLSSTTTSSGSSTQDVFVSKLDSAGNFIWSKSMGGLGSEIAYDIDIDNNQNVFSTGTTTTTVAQGGADFNPGSGVDTISSNSSTYTQIYVSKLDSTGAFAFVKGLGGSYNDYAYSISVDKNSNYFLGGSFVRSTTLGDSTFASYSPTNNYSSDAFILKGSATTGNVTWVKRMGSSVSDAVNRIIQDNAGHIYVGGHYSVPSASSSAIFPKDFTGTTLPLYFGSYDGFVAKLGTLGQQSWLKSLGGFGEDHVYALALDSNNNVYTSGSFVSKAYFNDADTTINTLTSLDSTSSSNDLFINKLDSNGNFVAIKQGSSPSFDKGIAMAATQDGDKIVVVGSSNVAAINSAFKFDPELTNGLLDTLIYVDTVFNNSSYYNGIAYGLTLSCNGTPDSSILAYTDTSICYGDSLLIVAQYPGNTLQDISFQWEQSTNGTDGWAAVTNGSGDSTLSYQTTALLSDGYYRLKTFCANSGDSSVSSHILHIVVNALPTIPTITQSGNVLTSSTADYYQWYKNDTALTSETAQSLDASNYGSGSYSVKVTNASGCASMSETTNIAITSVSNIGNQFKVTVYPVPFDNEITVVIIPQTGVNETLSYSLNNLVGQTFKKGTFNKNNNTIKVSGLASGTYFLNVTSKSGSTSFKLIKN